MRILRVFDFDRTITIRSTFEDPFSCYDENTKDGIGDLIQHNENQYTAIASFHDSPEFILTYLLPLLKLTNNDIAKSEYYDHQQYQLSLYHFNNIQVPLIIATSKSSKFHHGGKNKALLRIIESLPECNEYHFFDDDHLNIKHALNLNLFQCHLVSRDTRKFEVDLKNSVVLFLEQQVSNPSAPFFDKKENPDRGYLKELLGSLKKGGKMNQDSFKMINESSLYKSIAQLELYSPKKFHEILELEEVDKGTTLSLL